MNVQFKIYKKYNGSNIQRFENGEQCTLKGVTLCHRFMCQVRTVSKRKCLVGISAAQCQSVSAV